jgi:hypothetical protein
MYEQQASRHLFVVSLVYGVIVCEMFSQAESLLKNTLYNYRQSSRYESECLLHCLYGTTDTSVQRTVTSGLDFLKLKSLYMETTKQPTTFKYKLKICKY